MGGHISSAGRRSIQEFYTHFKPVSLPGVVPTVRKLFLSGAEPQWGDIYNNLDAAREINTEIVNAANKNHSSGKPSLIAITGSAGSGKSTLMKRAALTLSSLGNLVFFSESEELVTPHHLESALANFCLIGHLSFLITSTWPRAYYLHTWKRPREQKQAYICHRESNSPLN